MRASGLVKIVVGNVGKFGKFVIVGKFGKFLNVGKFGKFEKKNKVL